MIIDLHAFVNRQRPAWTRLEEMLDKLEDDRNYKPSIEDLREFHLLYQKTAADLTRVETFASEWDLKLYLESLVARAYSEIHEIRGNPTRLTPLRWFFVSFPQVFRRRVRAFGLSCLITILGSLFGAGAVLMDGEAKEVIMPFSHLQGDPSERVRDEESAEEDRLAGGKASFSAMLMTHNTRVSIFTLAMGITFGAGTILLLFYNGVILGAVCADYLAAGEGVFLAGWLLPHGSIEIPAILIAGQAGFVLASALLGWRSRESFRARLRIAAPDLLMLIFGIGIMLIWAGLIEAFFSQYHAPILPYSIKITFGVIELIALATFLTLAGRAKITAKGPRP